MNVDNDQKHLDEILRMRNQVLTSNKDDDHLYWIHCIYCMQLYISPTSRHMFDQLVYKWRRIESLKK